MYVHFLRLCSDVIEYSAVGNDSGYLKLYVKQASFVVQFKMLLKAKDGKMLTVVLL